VARGVASIISSFRSVTGRIDLPAREPKKMKPIQSPPNSFLALASWFHQDILYEHPSMDAAASGCITHLDAGGSAELSAYLAELVASDASDDELRKLWSDRGAEWAFLPYGHSCSGYWHS
jgi:hypothetical protein